MFFPIKKIITYLLKTINFYFYYLRLSGTCVTSLLTSVRASVPLGWESTQKSPSIFVFGHVYLIYTTSKRNITTED